MGDDNVKLLEQTVTNNAEDIRTLKAKVSEMETNINDLKLNQTVTSQTVTQVMESLTTLKADFKVMDNKMEGNIKDIHQEMQKSNERMFNNQIEQLKQYKTSLWTVGGSIIGSIIVGVSLFLMNV